MIVSYRDKITERFASGRHVKEFSGFARQAEMRLDRLETATSLGDLAALPETDWKRLKATAPDSFRFALTINGGSVSDGLKDRQDLKTSRSSTTIERTL